MSQPAPYTPVHSFVSDSATLPLFPGQALDVEFNDIKTTTDQIRANLALIQRDDGGLVNGSVTHDQLDSNLQLLVGDPTITAQVNATAAASAASATASATSAAAAAASATTASTSATNAAASATSAQGYVAGLSGTSTSSVTIATGSKSFTASTGKLWATGQFVTLSSNANSANFMHGAVTSYNSGTGALVVNVLDIGGSGTLADWNIAISGPQGTAAAGAVGISGTPVASQFGVWTNATTQKGIAITGLVKGNGASDPTAATAGTDYLAPGVTSTITKGYTLTPNNIGTVTTGTTTPDPTLGNYQFYTNNGAHTLAAPASDCAIDILITNGASAGSITFSGFTVSTSVGDALTTTNTSKFIVSIRRINSVSTYVIKALQ